MEPQAETSVSSQFYYTQIPTAPVVNVKEWFITIFLASIPIVGLVILFVWAFGGKANLNKANYAKASLIWALIGIVLYVLILVIARINGRSIFN